MGSQEAGSPHLQDPALVTEPKPAVYLTSTPPFLPEVHALHPSIPIIKACDTKAFVCFKSYQKAALGLALIDTGNLSYSLMSADYAQMTNLHLDLHSLYTLPMALKCNARYRHLQVRDFNFH